MSDPTRLTEIKARIFHGVPTTKDAEWLRDELAVVERERDEALRLLSAALGEDYTAADLAVSPEGEA